MTEESLNAALPSPTERFKTFLRDLRNGMIDESVLDLDSEKKHDTKQSAVAWAAENGFTEAEQFRAFADTLGLPFIEDVNELLASPEYTTKLDIGFSRRHGVLGIASSSDSLQVVICDWQGWDRLDVIGRLMRREISPVVSRPELVQAAINTAYQQRSGETQKLIESLDEEDVLSELSQLDTSEDLLDTADRAPVIKLVNMMLFEAVRSRASDVHIQPYENRVVVRQRIDGVLFDCFDIPKAYQEAVITRIKVLGKMNVAEKRLPQDGRATVEVGDRVIDLRIAALPTSHRERIVIRLLDKGARLYTLGELGMGEKEMTRFRKLIGLDHGLILVTGPTGSGKSTTLYAALQEINTKDKNVLTLEDPIEYQLDGVSQTQINEKKGMTFASGLRHVLRQDPDIIMVGEIRDHETAVMAIQASLTGHLVFSTLHTNDAASAVTRMLDLGIEPYLLASSLVAALAQRLVRKICPECKTRTEQPANHFVGAGCEACRQTGYQGRVGLFELLIVDERIREIVQAKGNATELREAATRAGMTVLEADGKRKAMEGITTIEEVLRVAKPADL